MPYRQPVRNACDKVLQDIIVTDTLWMGLSLCSSLPAAFSHWGLSPCPEEKLLDGERWVRAERTMGSGRVHHQPSAPNSPQQLVLCLWRTLLLQAGRFCAVGEQEEEVFKGYTKSRQHLLPLHTFPALTRNIFARSLSTWVCQISWRWWLWYISGQRKKTTLQKRIPRAAESPPLPEPLIKSPGLGTQTVPMLFLTLCPSCSERNTCCFELCLEKGKTE